MGYQYVTKEVLAKVEQCVGATCDQCGADLRPVFTDMEGNWRDTSTQNSLSLTLHGGYGEYYDGSVIDVVLCQNCAHALVELFPFLSKAIDESYF